MYSLDWWQYNMTTTLLDVFYVITSYFTTRNILFIGNAFYSIQNLYNQFEIIFNKDIPYLK